MKTILSIDPGETVGLLYIDGEMGSSPYVIRVKDDIPTFAHQVLHLILKHRPEVVVVENYVVYASKTGLHVGKELIEAQQIGAVKTVCAMLMPPPQCVVLPAGKKGRWPKARIEKKYLHLMEGLDSSPHLLAALQLALAYLEGVDNASSASTS